MGQLLMIGDGSLSGKQRRTLPVFLLTSRKCMVDRIHFDRMEGGALMTFCESSFSLSFCVRSPTGAMRNGPVCRYKQENK